MKKVWLALAGMILAFRESAAQIDCWRAAGARVLFVLLPALLPV